MTAIKDMTVKRLRAELVIAQGHLHNHRKGVHGSCFQRCEDPFPCKVARKASETLGEVSRALAARNELAEQIELTKSEWR